MGCEKSKCCKDVPTEVEVEIGGQRSTNSIQQSSVRKVPPLKLQRDDIIQITFKSSRDRNSKVVFSNENESTKPTRWDYTQSAFNSTTFRNSTQVPCLSSTAAQEVLISIAKAKDQLNVEYMAAEKSIKKILQTVIPSATILEDITQKLLDWQNLVYIPICKKTAEIKTSFMYSYSMTEFALSHEICAWSDLALLISFCEKNQLAYDANFFRQCERRISQLASLSMVITFEIVLNDATLYEQSSRIMVNYFVSARITKPFNSGNIPALLEGNVEQENLVTWYDTNQLMCNDFGFTINLRENAREVQLGSFIFGESGRTNLSNALSAFQSYGADFTQEQVNVLKKIPTEEFKVLFLINENGVSGVRATLKGIRDHLLPEFLRAFEQKYTDNEKVSPILGILEHEGLVEDKNSFTHFLEFSVDGFKVGCEVSIGKEHGSFIYIDTI